MRLRRASLLLIATLACGCRTPADQRAPDIPVERTWEGKEITPEEKEALLAFARNIVPEREIESIYLHSWYHPIDLPVATVRFKPVALDAERYEFVTLTALNRNWRQSFDESPPGPVSPPETCWYLEKESRWTTIKHRFRYRGGFLFLSIPEENTHQDIEEIVRILEQGKAVDESGKPTDFLSDQTYAIRRYTEDGAVLVEVSYARNLSGGIYILELSGDTLVLRPGYGARHKSTNSSLVGRCLAP